MTMMMKLMKKIPGPYCFALALGLLAAACTSLTGIAAEPASAPPSASTPAGKNDKNDQEKLPIQIRFTLPEAGWVTLVVEDESGRRVRNLIADVYFEKGENTVGWDGSDDLGRDDSAPEHGLYLIPTRMVSPGQYRVRGLWRKKVALKYMTGLYSSGKTPWETADQTGGWLANHTPPNAMLYVPDGGNGKPSVMIGSYVSEGTAGLAWVDLEGNKWKGQKWIGGVWTGAAYLARDTGTRADPGVMAYAASVWTAEPNVQTAKGDIGNLRITAITPKGDKAVLTHGFKPPVPVPAAWAGAAKWKSQIGGLAVHDKTIAVSMTEQNRLLVVEPVPGAKGKIRGEISLDKPRGLIFDSQGRLLVLSGQKLVRYPAPLDTEKPGEPEVLLAQLEQPEGITVDKAGAIYISDRGQSHQVKVFTDAGKPLKSFGKPGPPSAGPYDPLHMNNPSGMTVDSNGRLWVAEEDFLPKRVSVWNPDGSLWKAFYGPPHYGGGGVLDPRDKTRYYYQGMQLKLDWDKGTSEVVDIYYRPAPGSMKLGYRNSRPETPLYVEGRRYFTNCFNNNPTNGHGTAFIFVEREGVAIPVAAAGNAAEWEELAAEPFKTIWPDGATRTMWGGPNSPRTGPDSAFFVWSDLDGDGRPQPAEVQMAKARNGGITVMPDLSFVVSRLGDKAVRLAPVRLDARGVPLYSMADPVVLADKTNAPLSTGGDQVLLSPDGWAIFTTAPPPFSVRGIAGVRLSDKEPLWSYPSLWPGLHPSHEAPVPDRPGMLQGTTRVLGNFIQPGGRPMWMLNGNHGPVYVFTSDGLFVAQLFQDMRLGQQWSMPKAERGADVTDLTPSDENFWPSVTQMENGEVYMVAGRPNAVVKVEGLDTVRSIDAIPVTVTTADLARARDYFTIVEQERSAAAGTGILKVTLRAAAPVVDGKLHDWTGADWAVIDRRGTKAYFNSNAKPYDVTAAVSIAGDKLYAAWKTNNPALLKNSGNIPNAPFKTGGALDLMIGADGKLDPKRDKPAAGDQRLLVTQVNGKTLALVYRAVVAGEKKPVPFASPVWTVTFDRVDDVSDQVQLAEAEGNYEISVPLAVVGLRPAPGSSIRGDIGILRGSGGVTTQRVYWRNKATAIVSDVPSEAMLLPRNWGLWEFVSQ
ncbi:hypothetical protein DB346_00750 [Verrucomicrobia bacterium LW23]|nr:hypothetical protein DB346_00750 [Verrucomicrobia bacterium LW23]